MQKLSTSSMDIYIPVTGPDGVDLSTVPVSVALRLESSGGEPATGDYQAAVWSGTEAVLLIASGAYPDGQYLAFVRLVRAPEDVRLMCGRIRIGDVRP